MRGDGDTIEISAQNTFNHAYFTDSNNPTVALTLVQVGYSSAKFPIDERDEAAIETLAPGETYVIQYTEEDDDGEAPTWGTITCLLDDTTARALVRTVPCSGWLSTTRRLAKMR